MLLIFLFWLPEGQECRHGSEILTSKYHGHSQALHIQAAHRQLSEAKGDQDLKQFPSNTSPLLNSQVNKKCTSCFSITRFTGERREENESRCRKLKESMRESPESWWASRVGQGTTCSHLEVGMRLLPSKKDLDHLVVTWRQVLISE